MNRQAAILAAAITTLSAGAAGCSSVRSMLGMSDAPKTPEPLVATYTGETHGASAVVPADAETLASVDRSAAVPKIDMNEPAPGDVASATSDDAPAPANVNVYGEFDGAERPINVHNLTGEANLQQHTFLAEGYDGDVAVDPSGRLLVYSSTRHSVHPQIYVQRVDGLSVTQLTNDGNADNAYPCFSPDGGRIAFCSTRAGNWDIYVMDADGRNVVQVTSGPGQDMHPSFSPDGSRLAFCSLSGRSNQWELWTVDLANNGKRMIGTGVFPSWSPSKDGDRIAFQRARQRGGRWFSLWTLDLVDGEARNVTEVAVSTNAAIVSPCWSPDGRKLAFATIIEPSRTGSRGRPEGQQDIWTVNADGTNRQRVTDGNGTNTMPFWGMDNRVYFISNRGGVECVWSSAADSTLAPVARSKEEAKSSKPETVGNDMRDAH